MVRKTELSRSLRVSERESVRGKRREHGIKLITQLTSMTIFSVLNFLSFQIHRIIMHFMRISLIPFFHPFSIRRNNQNFQLMAKSSFGLPLVEAESDGGREVGSKSNNRINKM